MKTVTSKLLGLAAGAAALCAMALPAAASSWTQPGASTGAPAGALPPPGLYFVGAANYGIGEASPTLAVGVGVQGLIWNPGWTFLGASYAADVALIEVEVGVHNANYLRGVYNPFIRPVTLSWNLGNGFFVSAGSGVYTPVGTEIGNPGAAFEQHFNISYLANDWIASANFYYGITTSGSANGVTGRTPDYANLDLTLGHAFGKWSLGIVGYGAWDTQTTALNAAAGRGVEYGIGGFVGYNFGVVDLQFKVTHQVVTEGTTNYGRGDTRAWVTMVIPIWNPTPPAPKPLVAKY
jgi:Putative MetA-pathway of phenol degradation